MRIDEITGYHQNPVYQTAKTVFDDPRDELRLSHHARLTALDKFMDFLETHGFHKLGKGSYGLAFEKTGYPWIFKIFTTDDAYLNYVKYSLANKSNPNVPRFKGGLIKINDHTFAMRIEKLKPLEHRNYQTGSDIRILASILSVLSTTIDEIDEGNLEFIKETYPGVYKILSHYDNHFCFTFDIHGGNIMMRGNVPVIIDPIFDTNQ
jgi:hypothetical protein